MTTSPISARYDIVVGFDFSDPAHLALDHAFALAAMHSPAAVHVLGVVDETRQDATYEAADKFRHAIDVVAHAMAQPRMVPGVELYVHARIGRPADVILALAREVEAGLICVGSHGVSGLPRWVLGSVSEKVLRGADCPVLAMRPTRYRSDEEVEAPAIEPPCDACLAVRRDSASTGWWCDVHASHDSRATRATFHRIARQAPIRDAVAQPNTPMGHRPSVLEG